MGKGRTTTGMIVATLMQDLVHGKVTNYGNYRQKLSLRK